MARCLVPEPGQQAEPYLAVHSAAWAAEMARLSGGASVDQWVHVAHAWEELSSPHDAARREGSPRRDHARERASRKMK
jgi:hypothetical protein